MLTRQDSRVLIEAFTEIRNEMTGVGTKRDKSALGSANVIVPRLPDIALQNLPRISGMIERAVFLHILHGFRGNWYKLKVGEGENPEKLQRYINKLKGGFRKSMRRCAALGRQWGDGFAVLGIDDGGLPDEPVNEDNIRSVRWIKTYTINEMRVERGREFTVIPHDPEYYRLYVKGVLSPDYEELPEDDSVRLSSNYIGLRDRKTITDFRWHKSRVVRISGKYLYDEALRETGGYHDSVIQSMFNAWAQWNQGLAASSSMLQDYDEFTLGIQGLGDSINPDLKSEEEINKARKKIVQRGLTIDLSRSVARGLIYDKEHEIPGTLTRSYSGADKIMERLEDTWCAVSSVPKFKMFNTIGSTGLATGVQAATVLKIEWAILVQEYLEDSCRDELEKIAKYCALAMDSPIDSNTESLEVEFPLSAVLSPLETAELQKIISERDKNNIESGLYTGLEARYAYERAEFDINLNLEPLDRTREASRGMLIKSVEEKTKISSNTKGKSSRVISEDLDEPTGEEVNEEGRNLASVFKNKTEVITTQAQNTRETESLRQDDATPVRAIVPWNGLEIGVQYFPLEKRHGKRLQAAYGHIRKTRSPDDGMAIDVYMVIGSSSQKVYEVEQIINQEFDEYKYIIGANSIDHAKDIYLSAMPRAFMGRVRLISLDYLRGFLV